MKSLLLLSLTLSSLLTLAAQDLRVMTYNIRLDTDWDGDDRWDLRKAFLADQVRFYDPAIMGVQEALHHQMTYLDSALVDHHYVGVGRDDGAEAGEYSAIFYQHTVLELLDQGTFWLSTTPDKPSVGWDAAMERICTWGHFRHRSSGRTLWVFNTHFDHIGEQARVESARLIHRQATALAGPEEPVIIMGDLNLEPAAEPIRIFSESWTDAHDAANLSLGPEGTFNGFDLCQPITRRIDYIFLRPGHFQVLRYLVMSDRRQGHFPSDHLPVFAELRLNEE